MNFCPRKRRMPQVIIVSLIDIFAILLIFVIVTTTFKIPTPDQPTVTIKLPESKTAVSAEKPLKVTVISVAKTPDGEAVFLDAKPVLLDQLTAELKALTNGPTKPAFAMKADQEITYGFLIKVLDALKAGGVQGNLSAFTQPQK